MPFQQDCRGTSPIRKRPPPLARTALGPYHQQPLAAYKVFGQIHRCKGLPKNYYTNQEISGDLHTISLVQGRTRLP